MQLRFVRTMGMAMLCTTFAIAGAAHASDLLLVHGRIYTAAQTGEKWAEAIAITGDHIDAVGSDTDIMKLKTDSTKVVDLQGKMVVPGFTDDHVHLWFGSLALHGFNLSTPESTIEWNKEPDLFAQKIKEYADSHPDEEVLIGRAAFSNGVTSPAPTHEILDKIVPDRPLVIHATSEHTLWLNEKALELAGITDRPLPDPSEEKYVMRDGWGRPTGILREAAMQAMERAIPDPPLDEKLAIFRAGEKYLNSFGITSVVLASGGLWDLNSYEQLRERGELTLRMRQSFGQVAVNHHLTPEFLADLETARTSYHDDWISADEVKFFMDGAPSTPLYTTQQFAHIVGVLDKLGYHIMTHALAPASAKVVLDGFEIVEKENGPKDRRFRMEHAGRLYPEDVPRFGQLGIIASMQPAFCCSAPGQTYGGYPPGKSNQWHSLMAGGAMLEFSSDWPCSWPPSPILGIQQAVLRRVRRTGTPTGLTGPIESDDEPNEAITAEQALIAYTRNAAYVNFTDKKLGTLEAGKLADMVVLSKNILEIPAEEIGTTKVMATMVDGKVVYGSLE